MLDKDQKEISAHFAREIRTGASVFQMMPKLTALPVTIDDEGKEVPIFGVNGFILMQMMYRNGYKDPRWLDLANMTKRGWVLGEHPGGPVRLGFYKLKDEQGQVFDVPKKYSFDVQNARDIIGIPEYKKSMAALSAEQIAAAYGLDDADAVNSVVMGRCHRPMSNPVLNELHAAMVQSLLNVETKLSFKSTWEERESKEIADYLEKNPLALYETAKSAYQSVGQFLQPVKEYVNSQNIGKQLREEATVYRNLVHERKVSELYEKSQALLHVPFYERKEAIKLGAVWHPVNKLWFVPEGVELKAFDKWNPDKTALSIEAARSEIIKSFKDAMALSGLDTTEEIIDDGEWHSVSVLTKRSGKNNKAGSYLLTLTGKNGKPSGHIFNRDSGESLPWSYEGNLMSQEQRAYLMAEASKKREEKEQTNKVLQDQAAKHAEEIMAQSVPATAHPYVVKKGMVTANLRQISGEVLKKYPEFHSEKGGSVIRSKQEYLLVPMYNIEGQLRAVQAISEDGAIKCFMRKGQKSGTYFLLGAENLQQLIDDKINRVAYAEGISTGDAFKQIIDCPVFVCFDAGNMSKVVELTNRKLPKEVERVIAADNDQFFIEKMLATLSEKMGIINNPAEGKKVSVSASQFTARIVGLGMAEADGAWHKTGRGSYKLTLDSEKDCVVGASLDMVIGNERMTTLKFRNRGIDAAKECEALLSKDNRNCLVAIPSFDSLENKPTDWNDLLKIAGKERAIQSAKAIEGLVTPDLERKLEQTQEKSRGILRDFKTHVQQRAR